MKPNILWVIPESLSWAEVHSGSLTPTLRSLSHKGLQLDQFRQQSWCSPSRFAMLTGRSPCDHTDWRLPLASWSDPLAGETTVADVMASRGYDTHLVGKYHLGGSHPASLPTSHGFRTFVGFAGPNIDDRTYTSPDHSCMGSPPAGMNSQNSARPLLDWHNTTAGATPTPPTSPVDDVLERHVISLTGGRALAPWLIMWSPQAAHINTRDHSRLIGDDAWSPILQIGRFQGAWEAS